MGFIAPFFLAAVPFLLGAFVFMVGFPFVDSYRAKRLEKLHGRGHENRLQP